ncbi:MAG TPA: hypothetical protein ENI99_05890 [Sedimenticola sp.]|nr:hypothetical protein [Sedimenticola sp.]
MNRKILTGTGLAIAVALFLAANIVSNAAFRSFRLDLTDNKLYTLSEGTRNILKGLEEPITLRLYISKKLAARLPTLNSYTVRVRELLEEYQRNAGDKIELLVLDPEPFSEEEDRAVSYGLQGVPIDDSNTIFYFGLAANNSVDDEEIIPFFQPDREEQLEYDLTQLIYKLAHPKKPVVGIISTLPIQGDASAAFMRRHSATQPWIILEQIRQLFSVRMLEKEVEQIPSDVDVLMLVHPRGMSSKTLYAIDQFVLGGGRSLVFVDPYAEAQQSEGDPDNPLAAMQAPRNSELDSLLNAWGLELVAGKVAADMQAAKRIQARLGRRNQVFEYPVWMDLQERHYNKEDIVTQRLGGITLATAGILMAKEGAGTTMTPLLETGEQAMQVDATQLGMFTDPRALLRNYRPGGKRLTLAARISGPVKSAFPDGRPDAGKEEQAGHLTESKGAVNLIVVADSDLLDDRFWVRVQDFMGRRIAIPTSANGSFVTNALDNLTGSNDLISVRNRGSFARPFTKLDEFRKEAEKRFLEKEQQLQTRLRETEQKLRELQNRKQEGDLLALSAQQQQEIANFRREKVNIRKELRNVQHELRKDIEHLEGWIKFINIGLVPLLIGLGGIAHGLYRLRRRRAAQS